ncbi:MAG TPA: hypothetical protein VFV47_09225 [Hyphomicrobiaceae bacterium]|nr:hypothetical protein [Hyphomicrobiaceae bacterium]
MAKSVTKAESTKPRKATPDKPAQSGARAKKPTGKVEQARPKKEPSAPRARKEKTGGIASVISSLYETATEIVSDRLEPSIDQIKALARAVIGHEEKKVRKPGKEKAKPAKPSKGAKRKAQGTQPTKLKQKKKKNKK